jgi:hypothetical protein
MRVGAAGVDSCGSRVNATVQRRSGKMIVQTRAVTSAKNASVGLARYSACGTP